MVTDEQVISQTKKWINDMVIGCNFCPFAASTVKQQTIFYQVENSADTSVCLEILLQEIERLDDEQSLDTTLLVLPNAVPLFDDFLALVEAAEQLMIDNGCEGVYQLASFHPDYLFAGAPADDAANYTNRSVYPMLHLLRESSIDKALEHYKHPEDIPGRNIEFARNKGLVYMKMLRDGCLS